MGHLQNVWGPDGSNVRLEKARKERRRIELTGLGTVLVHSLAKTRTDLLSKNIWATKRAVTL
jgi:hypothetical protein